ncbi:MAG: AfsR/SARP family transcriptional regulator [Janthinobacterium lividum]
MDLHCEINLLGALHLTQAGETQTRFGTQKAAALLAFLALRLGPHSREQIIDLFWPEMDLPAGRSNLSTTLSSLRRQLEPAGVGRGSVLIATHLQVGLNPAAVTTDVVEFERLLKHADKAADPEKRADLFQCALALYRGGFQPGNYSDWAVREAERLEGRRIEALDSLASALEAAGRYDTAAAITQERLLVDPFAPAVQVALVRRRVRAGQPAAAREAARRFVQIFEEEFGAGPESATLQMLQELLAETTPLDPVPVPPPSSSFEPGVTLPARSVSVQESQRERKAQATLPFWLNRFLGREPDLMRLASLLLPSEETPSCSAPTRLVTLSGPGGAGKTRLAAEFGRALFQCSGWSCVFVPLSEVSEPDQIPARIAQALHLAPSSSAAPLDQVISFLAERQEQGVSFTLLVLDNLEHLLGSSDSAETSQTAAETVVALLGAVRPLAILCTSRRQLGIAGEQVLPLGSLSVPNADDPVRDLAVLAGISSVQLYIDRARSVRPDFGLTPTNAPAVAALCRVLEGSPLALELAASWVRLLPPRKMWERLAAGLELPEGRREDLPDRHRSLSAALSWSWRLLTSPQQRFLARLSVFRGGWTAEASEAVGTEPAALELLAALEEASLVTTSEDADGEIRYSLLETVRQYAAQRLAELGELETGRGRHLAWFLVLAEAARADARGPKQSVWLTRLEQEHDNLRAALGWAAQEEVQDQEEIQDTQNPGPSSLRLAGALEMFWRLRGHYQEGRASLAAALARPDSQSQTSLRAEALHSAALLAGEQGDLVAAWPLYEEALVIRRHLGDFGQVVASLNNLAIIAYDQGDSVAARRLWEEALALARQIGVSAAAALANLGELTFEEGQADKALLLLEEALALHRVSGSQYNIAYVLKVLVTVQHQRGDLKAAGRFLAESLPIQHELGNRAGIAQTLEAAAALALTAKHPEAAARLAGAASALRATIAVPLPGNERVRHEETVSSARAALGTAAFQHAFVLGQERTWQQAAQELLRDEE